MAKPSKTYAFKTRYVTFSSSSVQVDLNSFLSTDKGKELIKKASKPAHKRRKQSGDLQMSDVAGAAPV